MTIKKPAKHERIVFDHPADASVQALNELNLWQERYEALWKGDTFLERGLRTAYLTLVARLHRLGAIYGAEPDD